MEVLNCKNISKSYAIKNQENFLLKVAQLSLEENKIYTLLGPNGSGKSTLIKIILNLIFADTGEVSIFGINNYNSRSRELVGYIPEDFSIPPDLTFYQFLKYFGVMNNTEKKYITNQIDDYC